jgi:hypothetical protein
MSDNKHNGWTNYATWRVNLEIFDGQQMEDIVGEYCKPWETPDPYEVSKIVQEYAEDIVFLDCNLGGKNASSLMEDYAKAFLSDVNWYEIAEHLIQDFEFERESERVNE